MNSISDRLIKQYGRFNGSKSTSNSDVFESTVTHNDDTEAKQLTVLAEWMNSILPDLNLPEKPSSEELRACLIDGTVLLQILSRLRASSVNKAGGSDHSTVSRWENVKQFLESMDELGIPRFEVSDLEKGSMRPVLDCLLTLRVQFVHMGDNFSATITVARGGSPGGNASPRGLVSPTSAEENRKFSRESKFQQTLRSPFMSEPSAALMHHVGHKFHEVFQLKQGRYADLSAAKISEMMKSNSLDNAPTQSLLSVVNGILDESIERKTDEIPHRVACLLRKVVQEIERRISTQAEHLRTQNNVFKAREEKYQSRIRVLEALASGTGEERGIVMDQLQQIKIEKSKIEETKKLQEEDVVKLMKEKEQRDLELSALKQEIELAKKTHELRCLQMETEAEGAKTGLEERLKDLEHLLEDSRNKVRVLEAYSETKYEKWNKKEHTIQNFVEFQFGALQELRLSFKSIKHEILKVQNSHSEELNHLGIKLKTLVDATENYHLVLAENRRMHNELQDLKGNIRVYCRIRPFLPGQAGKRTTIEYIGENGELAVVNPSKQGKDSCRMFRFNKVFGPDSTQAEVFSDTQPLIQSVLDGYRVCIFAYGQTGSGKTYTMTGPNGANEEDWGVNYRALNDLFKISQSRKSSFMYEVGVQMVEIYNEQVRDLLSNDGSQKKLGILSTSQPNGLAVPDASTHPVTSTSDVLELMNIGLNNRAVGATAMNERSSRSHSVVSIHVRGKDLHTGATLHGNLHLVDLAGSERVDRSEVTGDRLKEAQHINKSLSALGDVIFALAQKSSHVPYRNSKLTQLLQSSLGGQAKTLMFVQLNPDVNSYSETFSTLKFAERVSGVELGTARSSKEGRDVRELMEQVASLKDTIAKKDDEIERLQLLKDMKNIYPSFSSEKQGLGSLRYGKTSEASNDSVGDTTQSQKLAGGKNLGLNEKAASNQDNSSEHSDKHSEADSQLSMDELKHQNRFLEESKSCGQESGQDMPPADAEILEYGDGDSEERLSDISDGGLSQGAEADVSAEEGTKLADKLAKSKVASKIRSLQKASQTRSTTVSRDSLKGATSTKKTVASNSTLLKPPKRWQ